jgi:peroxiredoxin
VTSNRRLMLVCAVLLLVGAGVGFHATSTPSEQVSASGGPTLTGTPVSITSFRDHPVVLVFWRSSCGPCHHEQRALNTAYAMWSARGVAFLGVDVFDTTTSGLAFQSAFRVPYPSIADTNATLAADYRVPQAPALVFLNARGKVAEVVLGGLGTMSVADFNAEITTLLGTSQAGSA